MEKSDSEKLTRLLSNERIFEPFDLWLSGRVVQEQAQTVKSTDFFTESALLMKKEARIAAISEIRDELRSRRETAKSEPTFLDSPQ